MGTALRRAVLARTILVLLLLTTFVLSSPLSLVHGDAIWQQTRGPFGGRVNALLIDPDQPSILYAGTESGIFISQDGGAVWYNSSQGLKAGSGVRAIAATAGSPGTVYAATDDGLYRSSDNGRLWSRIDREPAQGASEESFASRSTAMSALCLDPTDELILYAGSYGAVFRSADGGNGWTSSSSGLPSAMIRSLVVDPGQSNTVYAGTDEGVFRSADGGAHWQDISASIARPLQVAVVTADPSPSAVIYVATQVGVYRSTDRGMTWQATTTGIGSNPVTALAMDPHNAAVLYAAVAQQGVVRTANGGATWEPVPGKLSDLVYSLSVNPVNSRVLYAATARGVFASESGQQWEARNEGLIVSDAFSLLATAGSAPALYALTGPDLFKTRDEGKTWSRLLTGLTILNPGILAMTADPRAPNNIYAGTWYSEVYASDDGGSTWRMVHGGVAPDAQISSLCMVHASRSEVAGTLYAATNGAGVFISQDLGKSWSERNEGLADPFVQVLVQGGHGGDYLYAGTGSGVYRLALNTGTLDAATRWQAVSEGLARDEVRCLVADPRRPQILYAATATDIGHVYRSSDGGLRWTVVGSGQLPTNVTFQTLAFGSSAGRRNRLYAGTDGGVYSTDDDGATWQAMNEGLPPGANVRFVVAVEKRPVLYASIGHSGVYRMVDAGAGPSPWGYGLGIVLLMVAVVTAITLHSYATHASAHDMEAAFRRNWPLWRQEIQRALLSQNRVTADSLTAVPPSLRLRALQEYARQQSEDNLVLQSDPLALFPRNDTRVGDFLRNWSLTGQEGQSAEAYEVTVRPIVEQLCQLLGFSVLEHSTYNGLLCYVVRAPASRLRLPPRFPIVFVHNGRAAGSLIPDLHGLMSSVGLSSYMAVLVLTGNDATEKGYQLKAHLRERSRHRIAFHFAVLDLMDLHRIQIAKESGKRFIQLLLNQVDLTVLSPYVTAGPVPDAMFFGRESEIRTLIHSIGSHSFAIVGGSQMGRTSLLLKLHGLAPSDTRIFSLYLDCQSLNSPHHLVDAIAATWKLPVAGLEPEDLAHLVTRMALEKQGQHLVILLDNVDALMEFDASHHERLVRVLLALSRNHECQFVLTGGRRLWRQLSDPRTTLFSLCSTIRLGQLSPRDTGRVVLEPMQEMGIDFENVSRLVQGVTELSGGHPNLVQYICREVLVRLHARGDRFVTMADLQAIAGSSRYHETLLQVIWSSTQPLERLIALMMAERSSFGLTDAQLALQNGGVRLPARAVEEALDLLVLEAILRWEGQEFSFTSDAFVAALQRTQSASEAVQGYLRQAHGPE